MKKIIILGAGMVGKAMATDLARSHVVTSADKDAAALFPLSGRPNIHTVVLDVTDDAALSSVLSGFDLVISAVPGFLGMQTMLKVIRLKKDLVDISFMPEDVMHLDSLAKENGVTAVMDCGVAPGMPNYITGYYSGIMHLEEMEYMVGGLPRERTFPFEYKAPFSPCDVIEEYTRPARFVEDGKLVVKPAMSDAEYVYFNNIGTLEAFNTDGLRSLIKTMQHIPCMKEKTLRYPGHINLIRALSASGFLDKETVTVNGTGIVPLDFTSHILFKAWKLGPEEPEFTVMRVILRGKKSGVATEVTYELYDEYDPVEKISSMARTTGFTATGTAEMILQGKFTKKGLFPPELVGKEPGCFEFILNYLKERNVVYSMTKRNI